MTTASDDPIGPAVSGKARVPGLDGLRAVSIILVVLGHLAGTLNFVSRAAMKPFGDIGNLGVRIFFVISGFLITSILLNEIRRTGTVSLKRFYYRRTIRIFPACYVFIGCVAILSLTGIVQLNQGDLLHAATYTVNYHYSRSWWLGHLWSLSVEEQFYLLWPPIIVLLGVRSALWGAAGLIAIAPVIRLAMIMYWPDSQVAIGEAFPTVADSIATGCLLAGGVGWLRARTWLTRVMATPWFLVVPATAVLANTKTGGRLSVGIGETLINVCIALVVLRCSTATTGFSSRMLNSAPATYVGALSYSLYLWQQPFLNHGSAAAWASFPLNLILTAAFAVASYNLVEKPSLAFRGRLRMRLHSRPVPIDLAPPLGSPYQVSGVLGLGAMRSIAERHAHRRSADASEVPRTPDS